jgi:hypothetical protein
VIYPLSTAPVLDADLFRDPPAEYRGVPFWAWNGALEESQLLRQLAVFKQMGLGGVHIHVRVGLATPYLGDEFMRLVEVCTNEGKRLGMRTWLYDEDRWPSGSAGGYATADPANQLKHVLFTQRPCGPEDTNWTVPYSGPHAGRSGEGELVRRFAVLLKEGGLASYRNLEEDEPAVSEPGETIWYVYVEPSPRTPWFNNQTYLDTMSPAAVREFVKITHERYKDKLGDHFGTTIPAIFTDEPQYAKSSLLPTPESRKDVLLPFTPDFDSTYAQRNGESFLDRLPEFIWQNAEAGTLRYRFFEHAGERFSTAFAGVIGSWCSTHGIALTGHLMEEPTLTGQTKFSGDAMRALRGFGLPGIDLLRDSVEFTTAKQAQSVARQYGCEGVLSELYGVTGWDFEFRGHKLQGDWQAALGVTVRTHHLAWVTMAGEAKRDYPASIGYQSPWCLEYPAVEDHFARINTAMTRGKPVCRVAVVHPIESFWSVWGPESQTGLARAERERKFADLTDWLLRNQIDFDFVAESLLASDGSTDDGRLNMGQMSYEVVLLPDLGTIRRSTLDLLRSAAAAGVAVIAAGNLPACVDGVEDARVTEQLGDIADSVSYSPEQILSVLAPFRDIEVQSDDGSAASNLIYQLRSDGDVSWLFLSHVDSPAEPGIPTLENYAVRIRGAFSTVIFDTTTGDTRKIESRIERHGEAAWTVLSVIMAEHDSLLLQLRPQPSAQPNGSTGEALRHPVPTTRGVELAVKYQQRSAFPEPSGYRLSEPNVLLLDNAEWRLDDGEWQPAEEVLRLDNLARVELGWLKRGSRGAQPWLEPDQAEHHRITLGFTVESEVDVHDARLAVERPDTAEVTIDGVPVDMTDTGFWVDESIRLIALPQISRGPHRIEISNTITRSAGMEWCYLLGSFGVTVAGRHARIIAMPQHLVWGDITHQGFPFYAGNVTYEVNLPGGGAQMRAIQVADFSSPVIRVTGPGVKDGIISISPYTIAIEAGDTGNVGVEITAYGNRQNAFGPAHCNLRNLQWYGPSSWRTEGAEWAYEYRLKPFGILSAPVSLG